VNLGNAPRIINAELRKDIARLGNKNTSSINRLPLSGMKHWIIGI
jgi:hypothetical protein